MQRSGKHGFTLIELLVATAIFAGVTVAMMTFSQTSLRIFARNLSVNHSHDSIRIADQQLLRDLHNASSNFRLMSFNGTNYTDINPSVTTDLDKLTGKLISDRANVVRFRVLAGGPYKITANATTASVNLTFDFSVGTTLPYVPQVGDKVVIPLISREYGITAMPTVPTSGSRTGVITISDTSGLASRSTRPRPAT